MKLNWHLLAKAILRSNCDTVHSENELVIRQIPKLARTHFETSGFGEGPVGEGLLGKVDSVLLVLGQPLGHDVGVGQGRI